MITEYKNVRNPENGTWIRLGLNLNMSRLKLKLVSLNVKEQLFRVIYVIESTFVPN